MFVHKYVKCFLFYMRLLCESDNLIPELTNTAYSCGRHGPVTACFRSARSGNVIPVPKTSTSEGVEVYIVYRNELRVNVFVM